MFAFNLTLVYLLINLYKTATTKVSFQTYPGLELPLNLYNHISIIHSNNIYIIGGITDNDEPSGGIYKSQLDVPYVDNRDRFEQIDTINIALPQHSPNPSTINQIICPNQCFTIINNITYIFIDYQQMLILLKYDLELETFIDLNTYNYFYNSTQFFNGCITNDNEGLIYSIGTTYSHSNEPKRIGLKYNPNRNKWDIIYANINNYQKHSMGCNIDSRNENIYLFGGMAGNSVELNTIDKYAISSTQMISLSDTLKYPQSWLTVTRTDGNYFLIYNGFNGIFEYFDANSETVLTYNQSRNDNLLFDVTDVKLDITYFGSFITNDILFVNGGENIDGNALNKKIKYVNTLEIFDTYINQNTDRMACATIYEPHWANLSTNAYYIDEYIWNSNSQILFTGIPSEESRSPGTISNQMNFTRPVVTILSSQSAHVQYALEYNCTNNSVGALHFTAAYLRGGSGPLVAERNTIYNVPYDSVMWASWNNKRNCDNAGAYFRGGVGSVFDKFSSKYRIGYCFDPADVINAYFFDYNEISHTKWEFYHNKCKLNMHMNIDSNGTNDSKDNKLFSIGDYISVSYILSLANKTNVPIYMMSDDILNVNHTIYINEVENNTCVICDNQQNYSCVNCRRGVQILDLSTYDIDHEYRVDVFTDNSSNLFDGHTHFIFERMAATIEMRFYDTSGNVTNFTNGIYPGMIMHFYGGVMDDVVPQPESNIIIEYDEAFNTGNNENIQLIHLDHINEACSFIIDNNSTVNCSYPIIIPLDMEFKTIENNKYKFDVYSDDSILTTNVPSSVSRKVQNISVIFPDSVALRDYLSVEIEVMDDMIYQPKSTVRVISSALDIDATIYIHYVFPPVIEIDNTDKDNKIDAVDNNDNNDEKIDNGERYYNSDERIEHCFVINHNTDANDTCEKGIGPIMIKSSPANNALKDKISLLSEDTYLANGVVNIPTIEGELVEYNHWITKSYQGNIIRSICPQEYCCQEPEGCVYFPDEQEQLITDNALCAENRNHSVALCGSCNDNYTKVFNSANCKRCDRNNWHYLLYQLLVAFVVVFLIILFDRDITNDTSDTLQQDESDMKDYKQLNQQHEWEGVLIMFFKVLILFYQTINYILWQAGYKFWGNTMIQILSLDSYIWFWIFKGLPTEQGVCFLKQITEMQYHGWYLFFPCCLIFALIVYALLFNVICKHFAKCTWCNFGGSTVFTVIFIVMFPVLVVLFIVLSCQDLEEYGTVHFYAGDTKCFDIYFVIAAIGIIVFVVVMMVICVVLSKIEGKKTENALYGLVRSYEPNQWYWDFMLFIRRLLIIGLITLQYVNKMNMHIALCVILFIFCIIEIISSPFKYKAALYMDVICTIGVILCLIIIIVNIDNNFYHDAAIKNSIISTQASLGDVNSINMSQMSPQQSATFISLSIIIVAPLFLSILWFIIQAICSCTSDGIHTHHNGVPISGENNSEGDSDTEETWGGSTQYKNRDNTLSAILETEYEDSKTRKTNSSQMSFGKRWMKKSKQKDGYQQINNAQALGNKNVVDEDSDNDSSYSESDEKQTTQPAGAVAETEMAKPPFIRKTKLQKLSVITEKPENKDAEASGTVDTNANLFAVDLGKAENDFIGTSPMNEVIIVGKDKSHIRSGTSPNSNNSSFHYTETSNDQYGSTNDESTTTVSDRLDPQKIDNNMELVSKVPHTSAMEHLMHDSDSDSDDTKHTKSSHHMPLNPLNARDNNEKVVTHSDSDDDHESDQGDGALDNLLCDVLDEKIAEPNQNMNENNLAPNFRRDPDVVSDEKPAPPPPHLGKLKTNTSMMSSHLSSEPEIMKAKKSYRTYASPAENNNIEEEYGYEFAHHEQDEIEEQKQRELLKQSTFQNVGVNLNDSNNKAEFKRNKNMTSPAFTGGDLGNKEFSVHSQHKTTAVAGTAAAVAGAKLLDDKKKQTDSEMSYSDATGTSTNGDEDTSYSTDFDSAVHRESWRIYEENLRKLFSYFAGYQRWNKKKGVYMSRPEVRRFLDIIELSEYWNSDEVFKKMDVDKSKKIHLDEFIKYFTDEEFNKKAEDLKKYVEKQPSWQLLLKSMDIFEQVDVDHSGQLDRKEFSKFGEMLHLDDKETDALWNTIDTDKSGQITIVELFEWFKKRLETAKKEKKKKHAMNDDESGQFTSRSSFSTPNDESSGTGSSSSTQNENENDDEKQEDSGNKENEIENIDDNKDRKLSYSSEHGSVTPFSPNKKALNKPENDNGNKGK